MNTKRCRVCEMEFEPRNGAQVTCGNSECVRINGHRAQRKKSKNINCMVNDIAAKAKAAGMSYGTYVGLHGL